MTKHSKVGASSAHRWFKCPGSIALSKDIPSETNEYAEEGTAAHELAEHCLKQGKPPHDYIGSKFNGFTVDEPMADAVAVYIHAVDDAAVKGAVISIEQKFRLDWIDKELFGTNDACVEVPFGKLTVLDYKHGAGVAVEVEENKQLMYYGLGALRQSADCNEIEFVIVQPRCPHPDGPVRRWSTTLDRMAEFEAELKAAVKATRKKDAPLHAGDHCRFCPARATCPELSSHSLALAKAEFADDGEIILPEPEDIDEEHIVKILQGRSVLESWLKSVYAYAEDRLRKGHSVRGYKLVQKTGHRKWTDEEEVRARVGAHTKDIYAPPKLKTPAQMEKVVSKELVAQLCETPITGEALVPETDSRPALITTSATEDFLT